MPTYTTNYNIPKPLVNNATDQDLWGGFLNSGMDIIDAQMKTNADAVLLAVPIGSVVDYAGVSAPAKWILCYGQAISRTTYVDLFTAIGTTYGSGDGSTTFNLPDCRGRVSAGQDDMGGTSANRLTGQSGGVNGDNLGAAGGLETHTLLVAEVPALSITGQVYRTTVLPNNGVLNGLNSANNPGSVGVTLNTNGGGGAHNNVQPTIILNKIIYAGV